MQSEKICSHAEQFSPISRLVKRAAVVAVLLAFCGPGFAQQPGGFYSTTPTALTDGSLLFRNTPVALYDGRFFPASNAISSMGMVSLDVHPLGLMSSNRRTARAGDSKDSAELMDLLDTPSQIYGGGEVGVSYGQSVGKGSAEQFSSYIIGTVGNDHFQLTAGAEYQESSFRLPRSR